MKNFQKIGFPGARLAFALFALLSIAVFSSGCVTKKKKGEAKVGWFKRGWHNMTAHYNYWFNANEIMVLTNEKLRESHKDNYNQLLELYPETAVDPSGSKGEFDKVIQKSSKAISIHRVSGWTDDLYLLLGQAQYMKKDFETAEATFQFFKEELDPKKKIGKAKLKKSKKKKEDTKKKKKKKPSKKKKKKSSKKKSSSKTKTTAKDKKDGAQTDDKKDAPPEKKTDEEEEKPLPNYEDPYKKGAFSRTSAYPEAMIWFGRTMTDRDKFEEADYHYSLLWEDPYFPKKLRDDLATAQAYNWLKQKRYDRAIPPLQRAIELTKKKKHRARLAFILAQLYEKAGQYEQAQIAYETVLRSKPNYEMEFNAKLKQIESAWENGKMAAKDADKALNRMISDGKNKDYLDQIYFTLATIALKEGLKKDAIAYLRKSLDNSAGNETQKAESYLKMADLYFEIEDFVQAKNYYDSTLTVLPNTDQRFKRVDLYAKNLTDIARLIETIAVNDSIVRVFRMSDADRKALGKKLKKDREAADAAAAKEKEEGKKSADAKSALGAGKTGPIAGSKPSSFYFYNDAFVKKGKKDFQKTWGERKLEDNWRRSKRTDQGLGDDALAATDSTQSGVSDSELDDIFQGIPKSEAELAVLHLATYEAMYQLGTLFRDKLENNKRCSGTLEEMLSRYPDTVKYEKEAWYYCHVAFRDLTNMPKAQEYYDKLVGKYPNSSYARTLSDPNFLNAQKQREKELNNYYENAFTDFKSGQYKSAFDKCQDAPRKYGSQNPLMPKFSLLSALCTGNLQGKEAYCTALADVIGRFPESSEATRAKEISRLLACKGFEIGDAAKGDVVEMDDKFTLEDDKLHYFLVAIDNSDGEVKIDNVKASVSDYNREFHKLDQLRISNIFLGTDTENPIIVIRKFDNREAAMKYLKEVENKKDFLGEAKKELNKELFVITQENYRRVLKNKTLDGYREFFFENYLN